MDFTLAGPIARAILYEGYLLYPYRTSSLKNGRPCAFGSLVPQAYSRANGDIEPWSMQTECLVRGDGRTTIHGRIRFLHHDGRETRHAVEREAALAACALQDLAKHSARMDFTFPGDESTSLDGCAEVSAEPAHDSVFKVRLRIENGTPLMQGTQQQIDAHTMFSTHAILGVDGGRFLSLIDPPADVRDLAATCRNRGVWPVLAGDRVRHDMILAAPIILYDHPQIAPESPGNLFDATEIDEILSLRILTLTDAEKKAMQADERSRTLLERTEKLTGAQLLALHGAMGKAPIVDESTARFEPGERVRLRPSAAMRSATAARQDIFDLALEGRPATIASIEQDFEGRIFYTVTLDDDPGRDLGVEGKPGHRFYFRREELERLRACKRPENS